MIEIRYEENLLDTMYLFADTPQEPLSELEVFTETILAKAGGNSPRARQGAIDMKVKADKDVQYIIDWILRDEPIEKTTNDNDADEHDGVNAELQNDTATNYDEYDAYDNNQDDEFIDEVALGGTNEALERSIACFYVAMHEPGRVVKRRGHMRSFAYLAAAVCLQEVERFQQMAGLYH
jgi:hypothetical protein